MTIHIGISGWRYAGWRGVFYPVGLRQAGELAFASRAVDTIDNGSHYSLQTIGSYRAWHDARGKVPWCRPHHSGHLRHAVQIQTRQFLHT